MATPTVSGTVSTTSFPTRYVIEQAYRRCRLNAQAITGEMIDVAYDQLYLMLSAWANLGIQLWCIEKWILPMYEAQAQLPCPVGTVDILNANLRQTVQQMGQVTQTETSYQMAFPSPTQIQTVGLNWTGSMPSPISINLQASTDGVNWTTYKTVTPVITTGNRTWTEIDAIPAQMYFQIVPSDGVTPLPISDFYLGNTPYEITMARLNRDDYVNLPNKTFQGRPLQYWYNRQRDQPLMTLWPAPSLYFTQNQVSIWRKRYIMDVGTSSNLLDIPQRWFDAVVYNLAVKLAESITSIDLQILPMIAAKAQVALQEARMEERDNSPIYWSPNLRVYTR